MMRRNSEKLANLRSDEVKALLTIVEKLSSSVDQNIIRKNISEDLLCLLKADFLASYVWNENTGAFENFVGLNVDPANVTRYLNHYQFCDPITPLLRKRRRATPVCEVMPQKELERTEFFAEFLMKDNHQHGINVYAYDGDLNIGDLRVWRTKNRPLFDRHDATLLNFILPYFQNALRNARVVAKANGMESLWRDLLENLNIALFLFNERSHLIFRNDEACRLEKNLTAQEYSSFYDYVLSGIREDKPPTKWGPFSLSVLKAASPHDPRPLTAVFVTRAELQKIDTDSIKVKYHLSPRETEICILVCKGLSASEVGRVLGISFTTVRTHLKHLFAKLDVTSRSELIYRLFEGFVDTSF